jgi:AcrR family transcriptional regulator
VVKADDRRAALLDRLADHLLVHGIAGSSLRPLAKAAQTSDRMLLYYFKDKSDMMTAILTRVAERLVAILDARTTGARLRLETLQARLLTILLAEDLWPYMRLWLEIAALAARDDPFYRDIGGQMARGFLAWGAAQLDSKAEVHERDAARLLIGIEGVLLLKSVGLGDVCQKAIGTPAT